MPTTTARTATAPGDRPRAAGRPRDARLDRLVLDAARALLLEVGYESLTIEAIARRAGVHRPAVYRRWSTKLELVHDAVFPADDEGLAVVDSGDLRRDLARCVDRAVELLSRPEVRAALPSLMVESAAHPDLQAALYARFQARPRAEFEALLARAVERGEAAPGVSAGVLFDMMIGAVMFHTASLGPAALARDRRELAGALLRTAGATPERSPS